ncbi:ABC 3 transport family protein, partial [Vibrio parahaemolyticus V-223/04]
EQLVFC